MIQKVGASIGAGNESNGSTFDGRRTCGHDLGHVIAARREKSSGEVVSNVTHIGGRN